MVALVLRDGSRAKSFEISSYPVLFIDGGMGADDCLKEEDDVDGRNVTFVCRGAINAGNDNDILTILLRSDTTESKVDG